MSRSRIALIVILLLVMAFVSLQPAGASNVYVSGAGPALQATPAPEAAPTPLSASAPPAAAPIGEGTQQVLTILGLVVLGVALIGGGIYLRRRWIATRY